MTVHLYHYIICVPQPEADSREEDEGLDTMPYSVGNYAIEYEVKVTYCSLNHFK